MRGAAGRRDLRWTGENVGDFSTVLQHRSCKRLIIESILCQVSCVILIQDVMNGFHPPRHQYVVVAYLGPNMLNRGQGAVLLCPHWEVFVDLSLLSHSRDVGTTSSGWLAPGDSGPSAVGVERKDVSDSVAGGGWTDPVGSLALPIAVPFWQAYTRSFVPIVFQGVGAEPALSNEISWHVKSLDSETLLCRRRLTCDRLREEVQTAA